MEITAGLDFGTHQSKVCIERIDNGQTTYEFFNFSGDPENPNYCLPSIVQINRNGYFEYGEVNIEDAKVDYFKTGERRLSIYKPTMPFLKVPDYLAPRESKPKEPELPKKILFPIKPEVTQELKELLILYRKGKLHSKENENEIKKVIEYKTKLSNFERNKKKYQENISRRKSILKAYENEKIKYNRRLNILRESDRKLEFNYLAQLNTDKENFLKREKVYQTQISHLYYAKYDDDLNLTEESNHFKYFKLASFLKEQTTWEHKVSPDTISVLYLAFILFKLNSRIKQDYFIQIGIPSGLNQSEFQKHEKKAIFLISSAYSLIEKVGDFNSFLRKKDFELIELVNQSENIKASKNLNCSAIPEAYAALRFITGRGLVSSGMNLLVDIGGGTADIALFTLNGEDTLNSEPDIHIIQSLPKGLNHIFEKINEFTVKSIEQIRIEYSTGKINQDAAFMAWSMLSSELNEEFSKIRTAISRILLRKNEKYNHEKLSNFFAAMKNRPIIFTGGGSMKPKYLFYVGPFSDIIPIQEKFKKHNLNLLNEKRGVDFSILGTALGLSMALLNDLPDSNLHSLLKNIISAFEEDETHDDLGYGLLDN
jgi:hypothetical protein